MLEARMLMLTPSNQISIPLDSFKTNWLQEKVNRIQQSEVQHMLEARMLMLPPFNQISIPLDSFKTNWLQEKVNRKCTFNQVTLRALCRRAGVVVVNPERSTRISQMDVTPTLFMCKTTLDNIWRIKNIAHIIKISCTMTGEPTRHVPCTMTGQSVAAST